MHLILGSDHHGIGKLFPEKHFMPIRKTVFCRNIADLCNAVPEKIPGFGHRDDLTLMGHQQG